MVSADKDEEEKIQEKSSNNAVQKDDAWTKLLFDYHKAILSTWDFGSKLAKGKFRSDISLQQTEPFAK
jgi:hypothetical protein